MLDEFVKTEMKLDAFNSIAKSTANDTSLSEQKNEPTEDGMGSVKHGRKIPSASRSKIKIPPTQKDVRKLFVGGIGRDVTTDSFHDFFSEFGKVIDSVVMFDRETQKSRGFGFVTFEDPDVALKLLGMGHEGEIPPPGGFTSGRIKMHERICEVKASEPKKQTSFRYSSKNSTSSSCSGLDERVPKQIQFQHGVGSDSSDGAPGGYDVAKNSINYHDSRTALYHQSNVEYRYVYDHQHNIYPVQPMFYYPSGGYYPVMNGMYYNQGMYHPYQYFNQGSGGATAAQIHPSNGAAPMYPPFSDGGQSEGQKSGLEKNATLNEA